MQQRLSQIILITQMVLINASSMNYYYFMFKLRSIFALACLLAIACALT